MQNRCARGVHRAQYKNKKMKYNLLQNMYDYHWDLFKKEIITIEMIFEIESEFIKRYELFTIYLN